MNIATIITVSLGLAMDAFAVSITSGAVLKRITIRSLLKIGIFFTVFQALMPLIGWSLGNRFSFYIKNIDHWIAFTLLLCIGVKMIYDSFKETEERSSINPLDNKVLVFLSLATSIDALAVGVSFAFLDVSIWFSIISIGIITFVLSSLGIVLGKLTGERLTKKAEFFGGIVLALIGIKILLEHLNFL